MISSYTHEKQLASIDGATSLGRLADETVLAALEWQATERLSQGQIEKLRIVSDWLQRSVEALQDPLHVNLTASGVPVPELNGFGAGVTSLALGLDSEHEDSQAAVAALTALQTSVLALADGRAVAGDAEKVHQVFEHVARTMLTTADAMLAPASRTAWATTASF